MNLPKKFSDALQNQTPKFRDILLKLFYQADKDIQNDILAFFESDPPEEKYISSVQDILVRALFQSDPEDLNKMFRDGDIIK